MWRGYRAGSRHVGLIIMLARRLSEVVMEEDSRGPVGWRKMVDRQIEIKARVEGGGRCITTPEQVHNCN